MTTAEHDQIITNANAGALGNSAFTELVDMTLWSVAKTSARVYGQTLKAWAAWCDLNGLDPLDLRPAVVLEFISEGETTAATRKRQLSALRKLAQMAYVLNPTDDTRRFYEALQLVRPPTEGVSDKTRARRALTPAQADKVLRAWDGDTAPERRNRALISLLALTGIRRAEAAALRWQDIDFENGIIHIAHGKGDKQRDVPVASDYALEALHAWRAVLPVGRSYVFCPVERGGHFGKDDKPITGTDIYRIVKATEELTGIEFKPHDLRRTLITEALATGTPIQTVQAIAGHSRGETTLQYAQAVDARKARKELKLRYG